MHHVNRYICLVSLLVTTLTTEAVQLGSAKGSAVFGRPLDLTMQVRLDTPFDEAANCFSVDVFQADNKFDAGRVRLDITPAANGLDATVHVRSVSAVNEPWAKVILRSNCGAKVSRQYDFLTDFAADIPLNNTLAESTPSQPATTIVTTTTTSSTLTANSQPSSSSSNATNATEQAPVSNWSVKRSQAKVKPLQQKSNSETALTALAPKKVKPVALAVVERKKTTDIVAEAAGQPRLKMETFELTDEHQVLLKLSSALIAPAGMRTPEEIQSLAQATAVWRAINGMPVEVKAATVPAAPVPTSSFVNQKLAGKSPFSNLVVYGLIGFLAMTLGCIAWLWLRVRNASRAGYGWLNDSVTADTPVGREQIQSQLLPAGVQASAPEIQEPSEPTFEEEVVEVEEKKAAVDKQVIAEKVEVANEAEAEIKFEFEEELKTPVAASTDNQIVSALPLHFDDPRFDERVLRPQKRPHDLAHDKPITSPTELMELVLADTPPKLRAVTAPALATSTEPVAKPNNATAVPKPAVVKDDSKGNLIDFDVFAEPSPADKPSRSAR
jgi:hypothetical protein